MIGRKEMRYCMQIRQGFFFFFFFGHRAILENHAKYKTLSNESRVVFQFCL